MSRARHLSKVTPSAEGLIGSEDLTNTAISGALGYTPANKAGDTLTGTFTYSDLLANAIPYLNANKELSANAALSFNGTVLSTTTLDLTNLEVTNIKAKDGTASLSIADSTGILSISANPILSGGTANGLLYLNGSKVATSGSALTFDGTTLGATALSVTGNTTLGDASTDTVTVNGYMGVGGAADSRYGVYLRNSALTGTSQYGMVIQPTSTSAATNNIVGGAFGVGTAASAFTVTSAIGLRLDDATKGAGSTITDQVGLSVADQTKGTNNYGITSLVSSGSNKWNIYASGTANNAFAGNVRIGSTTAPTNALDVTGAMTVSGNVTLGDATTDIVTISGKLGFGTAPTTNTGIYYRPTSSTITGSTTGIGLYMDVPFASDVTSSANAAYFRVNTAASAYTVSTAIGLRLLDAIKGAGSTITNQFGLSVTDQTQGTNNYGISSEVSSGTNKWNIYASGTAANYFAGNVGIGTSSPVAKVASHATNPTQGILGVFRNDGNVSGAQIQLSQNAVADWAFGQPAGVSAFAVWNGRSTAAGGTEFMRLDSSGNLKTVAVVSVGNATPATSGAGITFPATQNASTDANTLDDYEEGTYTPFVRGRDSSGTGVYTRNSGYYTKIGRTVTVHTDIGWSSHTGSGGLEISLPFPVSTSGYQAGGFVSFNGGLSYSAGYTAYGWSDTGGSFIRIWQSDHTGASLAVPIDTVVSELHFTYVYNTD